jgi:putative ABC transport system permease protein
VCPNAFYSGPKDMGRSKSYLVLLAEQQDAAPAMTQFGLNGSGESTFYVRYTGSLNPIASAVGATLAGFDKGVPLVYMRTMQQQLESISFGLRPTILLLTAFSATSLLIATIGQYAVITFDMRRRRREFGVRMAMGASSSHIVRSVLRECFTVTALGLTFGFALSAAVGTALRSTLYGLSPTDAWTYASVFALLTVTTLLASYIPARRASSVDPQSALRCE